MFVKDYEASAALGPSVRKELESFVGLLPLLVVDWWLPWSSRGGSSDASEAAFGVCMAEGPVDKVRAVGRVQERSRFHRGAHRARESSLGAAGLLELDATGEECRPAGEDRPREWSRDRSFPEVPAAGLRPELWALAV